MFYAEVDDNGNIIVVPKPTDKSIEIDDVIENYDIYLYDAQKNAIIKRNVIGYELTAIDNSVVISFNTDSFLQVNVDYNGQVGERSAIAGRSLFLESKDGKVELKVSSLLAGTIYISSGDPNIFFEALSIDSETAIDNEYNPAIYVGQNEVRIEPSIEYNRFRSLQKEMELLREEVKELRLAVLP